MENFTMIKKIKSLLVGFFLIGSAQYIDAMEDLNNFAKAGQVRHIEASLAKLHTRSEQLSQEIMGIQASMLHGGHDQIKNLEKEGFNSFAFVPNDYMESEDTIASLSSERVDLCKTSTELRKQKAAIEDAIAQKNAQNMRRDVCSQGKKIALCACSSLFVAAIVVSQFAQNQAVCFV
jgi:hypothetical protein